MTPRTSSLLAGVTLVAGLALPACSGGVQTVPERAADAMPVNTAIVAVAESPDTFEAGGIVQARTTATLMARLPAPVLEVRAVPGDRVRAGQVLLVLDGRDLAAQARRARAEGASADQDVIAAAAERQASEAALRVVDGTVTEVGRAVDAGVRSLLVKIELPGDPGLRSGMFGRARFSTGPRSALSVPAAALVHRGQVTSVFVVEGDIARVRLVNVRGTEVLAGLSEGEVVIVTPPPTLTDGRRVTVGGR